MDKDVKFHIISLNFAGISDGSKIYGNFIWRPVDPNAIVLDTEIEKENNLPLWAMRLLPIQFMALLPSLSIRG